MRRWVAALITVLRRPQWSIVAGSLVVFGISGQSAALWVTLLMLVAGLAIVALALRVMGLTTLTPMAAFALVRRVPSFGRLMVAAALLLLVWAVFRVVPPILSGARSFAVDVNGDPDLMTALVLATAACIFTSCVWLLTRVQHRATRPAPELTPEPVEQDTSSPSIGEFWRTLSTTLLFAVIGLVPAAFLENWAWNVAAAVVLPVLALSVGKARRDAHAASESQPAHDGSNQASG